MATETGLGDDSELTGVGASVRDSARFIGEPQSLVIPSSLPVWIGKCHPVASDRLPVLLAMSVDLPILGLGPQS